MQQVLVIEDDAYLSSIICRYLSRLGYVAWSRSDGASGEEFARKHYHDLSLIILDLSLPRKTGLQVCEAIRSMKIELPVIVISGSSDVDNIVKLLNAGADDYIVKPFSLAELSARAKSLLRRPIHFSSKSISCSGVHIDLDHREATYLKKPLDLRRKEFDLLYYLALHRNQTVTRDQILFNVWGMDANPFPNTIDVHIRQLRKKLGQIAENDLIQTAHGVGYRFKAEEKDMGVFMEKTQSSDYLLSSAVELRQETLSISN